MTLERDDRPWIILGVILIVLMSWGKAHGQTMDQVKAEIDSLEIQHPDIVLRQVALETGWLNCNHCTMDYNNLFGFRLSSLKSDSNSRGRIYFESWEESVKYYRDWQDRWYTGGDYYEFLLKIGYAEDEEYLDKLKKMW